MSRQGVYALLAVVIGLTIASAPIGLFPRWGVVFGSGYGSGYG